MMRTDEERAFHAHKRQMLIRRRLETMRERYGGLCGSGLLQIRMDVSRWFVDPADGLKTRVVQQVER